MRAPHLLAQAHPGQRGFSLIEIMVGLAIGMASVVIMLQLLNNADAAKRTTAGANDAQMNGSLSLYTLERDVRAAGYGITAFNILGCALSYTTSADSRAVTIPMAPVNINPQTATSPMTDLVPFADDSTDIVMVIYGNADGSAEGDALVATSTTQTYQISNETSFSKDDHILAQTATRPSTCTLTLDKITAVNGVNLSVVTGSTGLPVGSIIYNLGKAPAIKVYAVREGRLTVCDYLAYDCGRATYASAANALHDTVWVPVASNIMSLRAQYGRDNSTSASGMTGVVSVFDQATPGTPSDTSGLPLYCAWARTMALRMAVVSRSAAYNKDPVTTAEPSWSGTTVNAPQNPAAVPIDMHLVDPNWQHYRYKTLESSVPLRNAIWQGGQATYQGGSGC